jgi:putative ABC transport system permease protein
MKRAHFLNYAIHGIQRGGQRVVIALLSVAFGVMALIAMSILAEEVMRVLLVDKEHSLGAQARLFRPSTYLSNEHLQEIERLKQDGFITDFTIASSSTGIILTTPDFGRVTFTHGAMGIDPSTYPFVGSIDLSEPADAAAKDVLQTIGDAIITRDLASERGLSLNDVFYVTPRFRGSPTELRVRGIATGTPGCRGGYLFYTLDTADMIQGQTDAVTDVYVMWHNNHSLVEQQLVEEGWQIDSAFDVSAQAQKMADTFNFMLKGAGILGLIVGGIGIANTMQVLLARRRDEIAILKTLGYTRMDMIVVFVLEALIIGFLGSSLGTIAALALSQALVHLAGNVVTLMMTWHFDPTFFIGGLLTGIVTTVLFAMYAIVRSSDIRPSALFRNLLPEQQKSGWLKSIGFCLLMAIPFAGLTGVILDSLVNGLLILLLALAGLLVLGTILRGAMWVVLRLLPPFRFLLLRMARNNMRQRGLSLIFAMIALFIGVFALGLAITVIKVSMEELAARSREIEGENLVILSEPSLEVSIRELLSGEDVERINVGYNLPVRLTFDGMETPEGLASTTLEGRIDPWDIATLRGEPWGTIPDGIYLPEEYPIPQGTAVTATGINGQVLTLTVAGNYTPTSYDLSLLDPIANPLVSHETMLALGFGAGSITVAAEVRSNAIEAIADSIGQSIPGTLVITSTDVDRMFMGTLRNLFYFSVAMAMLALMAGAVLVANSVSLSMLDRQYEIGVLKAVGYSRRQVVTTTLMEYGLIAFIASLAGALGVELFIVILQLVQEAAGELLYVDGFTVMLTVLAGVGITFASALISAWRPTRVRPLVVLNHRT